jgi:hypothetical protein
MSTGMPETLPWYSKSYRRNLVDMHIDDWDERFLADLDAGRYADLLAMGHIKPAMLYANSHVGLNYWPSSVGRMHRGLGGRDYFGEITRACRERGRCWLLQLGIQQLGLRAAPFLADAQARRQGIP